MTEWKVRAIARKDTDNPATATTQATMTIEHFLRRLTITAPDATVAEVLARKRCPDIVRIISVRPKKET
jgi:hypothetical protein